MSHVVFDEATHIYTVEGQELPSVTEIIRFLSFDAAVGADKAMRDYAAECGTRIHEACTLYDFEGEDAEVDTDIVGYVQAYAAFKRDYGITDWLYYEKPLGSVRLGYAGTPDRIGLIDGCMTILDIKTGSKINKYALAAQLTGYHELAAVELGITNVSQRWGLHLKKNGSYSVINAPLSLMAFVCCRLLHNILKGEYDGK